MEKESHHAKCHGSSNDVTTVVGPTSGGGSVVMQGQKHMNPTYGKSLRPPS